MNIFTILDINYFYRIVGYKRLFIGVSERKCPIDYQEDDPIIYLSIH